MSYSKTLTFIYLIVCIKIDETGTIRREGQWSSPDLIFEGVDEFADKLERGGLLWSDVINSKFVLFFSIKNTHMVGYLNKDLEDMGKKNLYSPREFWDQCNFKHLTHLIFGIIKLLQFPMSDSSWSKEKEEDCIDSYNIITSISQSESTSESTSKLSSSSKSKSISETLSKSSSKIFKKITGKEILKLVEIWKKSVLSKLKPKMESSKKRKRTNGDPAGVPLNPIYVKLKDSENPLSFQEGKDRMNSNFKKLSQFMSKEWRSTADSCVNDYVPGADDWDSASSVDGKVVITISGGPLRADIDLEIIESKEACLGLACLLSLVPATEFLYPIVGYQYSSKISKIENDSIWKILEFYQHCRSPTDDNLDFDVEEFESQVESFEGILTSLQMPFKWYCKFMKGEDWRDCNLISEGKVPLGKDVKCAGKPKSAKTIAKETPPFPSTALDVIDTKKKDILSFVAQLSSIFNQKSGNLSYPSKDSCGEDDQRTRTGVEGEDVIGEDEDLDAEEREEGLTDGDWMDTEESISLPDNSTNLVSSFLNSFISKFEGQLKSYSSNHPGKNWMSYFQGSWSKLNSEGNRRSFIKIYNPKAASLEWQLQPGTKLFLLGADGNEIAIKAKDSLLKPYALRPRKSLSPHPKLTTSIAGISVCKNMKLIFKKPMKINFPRMHHGRLKLMHGYDRDRIDFKIGAPKITISKSKMMITISIPTKIVTLESKKLSSIASSSQRPVNTNPPQPPPKSLTSAGVATSQSPFPKLQQWSKLETFNDTIVSKSRIIDNSIPGSRSCGIDPGGCPLVSIFCNNGDSYKVGGKLWNSLDYKFNELERLQSLIDQEIDKGDAVVVARDEWMKTERDLQSLSPRVLYV